MLCVSMSLQSTTQSRWVGKSRGLVVKGEDSQLSGCGFESRRRILDGVSEASYYIGKEIKVAKWGTPKKYLKKSRWVAMV